MSNRVECFEVFAEHCVTIPLLQECPGLEVGEKIVRIDIIMSSESRLSVGRNDEMGLCDRCRPKTGVDMCRSHSGMKRSPSRIS